MENSTIPLHDLRVGEKARVLSLAADGAVRRRILDLGVIEGTEIASLYKSPSGNPAAYLIRGAVIALRSDITSGIMVAKCTNSRMEPVLLQAAYVR